MVLIMQIEFVRVPGFECSMLWAYWRSNLEIFSHLLCVNPESYSTILTFQGQIEMFSVVSCL